MPLESVLLPHVVYSVTLKRKEVQESLLFKRKNGISPWPEAKTFFRLWKDTFSQVSKKFRTCSHKGRSLSREAVPITRWWGQLDPSVLTSSSCAHFFLKDTLILDFRLNKRNSLLGLPRAPGDDWSQRAKAKKWESVFILRHRARLRTPSGIARGRTPARSNGSSSPVLRRSADLAAQDTFST